MPSKKLFVHYLLALLPATLLLADPYIAATAAEAQSSQPTSPGTVAAADETKPLEDKGVRGAPQQHEPAASGNE